MLLLEKNYVSKQLIESELTWEEKIERALVLWSTTAEQLGHKIWGVGRVSRGYKLLANTYDRTARQFCQRYVMNITSFVNLLGQTLGEQDTGNLPESEQFDFLPPSPGTARLTHASSHQKMYHTQPHADFIRKLWLNAE